MFFVCLLCVQDCCCVLGFGLALVVVLFIQMNGFAVAILISLF